MAYLDEHTFQWTKTRLAFYLATVEMLGRTKADAEITRTDVLTICKDHNMKQPYWLTDNFKTGRGTYRFPNKPRQLPGRSEKTAAAAGSEPAPTDGVASTQRTEAPEIDNNPSLTARPVTFTESDINTVFERNLRSALAKLSDLEIHSGAQPRFTGLSGWVFEQTVQYCLRQELQSLDAHVAIREQAKLAGRVDVDLQVGSVFLEIKNSGCFSSHDASKYARYQRVAKSQKREFLFLTAKETYHPYRDAMVQALGAENVFFLDTHGDWARLVTRLLLLNAETAYS